VSEFFFSQSLWSVFIVALAWHFRKWIMRASVCWFQIAQHNIHSTETVTTLHSSWRATCAHTVCNLLLNICAFLCAAYKEKIHTVVRIRRISLRVLMCLHDHLYIFFLSWKSVMQTTVLYIQMQRNSFTNWSLTAYTKINTKIVPSRLVDAGI